MKDIIPQTLGAIFTPPEFAELLANWAIRTPEDSVLDLGIGEGTFVFAAFDRLIQLGASVENAQQQIYGAEIDTAIYQEFLSHSAKLGLSFPNIINADFFSVTLPKIDVVVGNPPYVRRTHMDDIDSIRKTVLSPIDPDIPEEISRLADLYVYFLLHASKALKPNGRLAVLTADSWLNVGYGKVLRKHLLDHYRIGKLVTFDRRIFENAQVKPVFILATKNGKEIATYRIDFIRVRNGLPTSVLQNILAGSELPQNDIMRIVVEKSILDVNVPWGIYFKFPEFFEEVKSHPLLAPIKTIANTRIGLQTLAKDFFVLTPESAARWGVEENFLQPLANSTRTHSKPTIDFHDTPSHYLFYCSVSKDQLEGTKALTYIQAGESTEVPVRGKGITVTGYQSKQRIKEDRRKYWYDLKTAIERRGRATILIPRLIYREFTVVWNKARFVPGELFIEFVPCSPEVDIEVYLSILSCTLTEIMLRSYAQVYGGGTYNLNPGQIINVPIVDPALLSYSQREALKYAYQLYLDHPDLDRTPIDQTIYEILGYDEEMQQMLQSTLSDLRLIATSSKQRG